MFSRLRQRIEFAVFFISAMALVFGYGIAVERWRLFPHAVVESAIDSARDWKSNWHHFLGIQSKWLRPTEHTERISWRDKQRSWPGYTFYSAFHNGSWGAFLIDMQGKIVHEWLVSLEEIWKIAGMTGDLDAESIDLSIHGAELLRTATPY